MEKLLRAVDRAQQRFRATALVFGVVKKYGDDNGGVLAANLTYTAFVSIFPLLLVLVTVLGLVAAGDPGLMYLAGFRILTPRGVAARHLIPGAVLAGILWTVLQLLGTYLVHHFLHSDSVYGVFATVLGLIAWLYLAAQVTVYCAELNVVLARRLWPRSLIQPPLTEADRASMALQALQSQRREEQQITVTFRDREPGARVPRGTPQSPGEISPPAPSQPE